MIAASVVVVKYAIADVDNRNRACIITNILVGVSLSAGEFDLVSEREFDTAATYMG